MSPLMILFFLVLVDHSAVATTYYVAINGNDSYDGLYPSYQGSPKGPFKTINKGTSALGPGDTLYLRGGTYHQTVSVPNSGTSGRPITIANYPNETAVLDGQDTLPTIHWGSLFSVQGNYVVVRNLEMKNSNWMGLHVSGTHVQVVNVSSHHHMENGILVSGNYGLVKNCRVWWNCKSNEYGSNRRGNWASGLSAARHPQYVTIRDCVVWNNWGEGLSTFEASHTTMEGNVVYDNQTNIYISDTTYCLCHRNLVYSTPNNAFFSTPGDQVGIMMGDERYTPPSSNNTVINNLCLGNKVNLYWWQGASGGGLVNALIAYNTLVNSVYETNFRISAGAHSNSRVQNNIFIQEGALPVAVVPTDVGLSFANNCWAKTPPSTAVGTADVVGDPQLTRSGQNAPGVLTADWFKILTTSPARDKAKVLPQVPRDFFKAIRGSYPDIGAHEYGGGETESPNLPAGLRIP